MKEIKQEKSLIKQNILFYLGKKGVTPYEFYKITGVTRGILQQNNGISEDNLARFLVYATDVSYEWLLTGNGPMLKQSIDHPSVPEKQPETPDPELLKPRSNSAQTPIRKEIQQQKADPSPDVILSLLETIRQQAEEIGMLKERLRASEEERAKLADNAQSSDIADAG